VSTECIFADCSMEEQTATSILRSRHGAKMIPGQHYSQLSSYLCSEEVLPSEDSMGVRCLSEAFSQQGMYTSSLNMAVLRAS
jgi:hypothetical protein